MTFSDAGFLGILRVDSGWNIIVYIYNERIIDKVM